MSRLTTWISSITCLVVLLGFTPPAFAVGNAESAERASRFIAIGSAQITEVEPAIDALFALIAAADPMTVQPASRLVGIVKDKGADYVRSSPLHAARMIVLADALGTDTRTLIGIDALPFLLDGVQADGSFGGAQSPAQTGFALVALARANFDAPQAIVRFVVSSANPDGGFGASPEAPSDAESTGLALMGLLTLNDSISARETTRRAVDWAIAEQQADGSWSGPNRIIATAHIASALQGAGTPQPKAVHYVVSEQSFDGSMPRAVPDAQSVSVATLLLADTNYLAITGGSYARSIMASAPTPTARPVPVGTQSFPWALPVLGGLVVVAGVGLFLTRRGASHQASPHETKP